MMKKKLLAPIIILVLVILYSTVTYNSIIKKEEKVKQDWSEMQNTYQRRLDLIPNLVSVVKGVSEFEKTVLQQVAEARSNASRVFSPEEITKENFETQKRLQDSLVARVNRMILLIEAYPELRATQAYLALQKQLEGTERRIVVARKDFNESVFNYNKTVKAFPANLVAGIAGFKPKQGFESVEGADQPAEIKFNQ